MTEEIKQDIFYMDLHDVIHIWDGEVVVLRVPGGWIYTIVEDGNATSCFVPYTTEYNPQAI